MGSCTCRIVESASRSEGPYKIEFCPLHKAAGEMYGACRMAMAEIDAMMHPTGSISLIMMTTIRNSLERAIAKAEGKSV